MHCYAVLLSQYRLVCFSRMFQVTEVIYGKLTEFVSNKTGSVHIS